MKKLLTIPFLFLAIVITNFSCQKFDFWNHHGAHYPPVKNYDATLAVAWNRLQMKLTMSTPGFSPGVTARSFGYSGLALYESVQAGIPGYRSIASQLSAGLTLPAAGKTVKYYWPASANTAMATVLRGLFAATSPANLHAIDSLEAAIAAKFDGQAGSDEIANAVGYGNQIATAIFDWSKLDGSLTVYPPYTPKPGAGLWVPTPPAMAPAAAPYSGGYRSFIAGVADAAALPPPIAYSEEPGSPFYEMVNQVYTLSLSLSSEDSTITKFWADLPGQFNGPAHFTSVLTQLIEKEKLNLIQAAELYAKHGMAINDAGIASFKTKYLYNLLRPITYIRGVMGHPDWNAVIATPPHPEYSSAHAVNMQAAAEVLKEAFGEHYGFSDHTSDSTYGTRWYKSFDDYAEEGMWSRIIGGIHYLPSGKAGLAQGKIVGKMINKLRFHD